MRKLPVPILAALAAIVFLAEPYAIGGADDMNSPASREKLVQLARAGIMGVHAYQVLLFQKENKGDAECYAAGSLSPADLEALVAHQAALLADDTVEIAKWVRGEKSAFEPGEDLEPLLAAPLELSERLPVNVFTAYLEEAAGVSGPDVLAIANLYQTCLEMERDGTVLWDEMFFYRALGYKTYVGQLGLPGTDADFLAAGEKLAAKSCSSPFGDDTTTAFAWQIAARKVWNWGEKYAHERDQYVLARELLGEPDIRVLVPRIKKMPAQRIAIIGHSFSMQSHWAAPGSFPAIVAAVFQMENPDVVTKQWFGGGLTATRAYRNYYQEALAWKPDKVLFVVAIRRDEDLADLKTMCAGFREAGAQTYIFDNLRDPSEDSRRNQMDEKVAGETGLVIIEVGALIAESPDKDKFMCLDNIHMTEPYHMLMAREWLKLLTGAREAELGGM